MALRLEIVYKVYMNSMASEILKQLKNLDIRSVILFGSYAKDTYDSESDIDLVVILDSERISQSYDEKLKNKMLVRNCLYDLSRKQAIDLVVYTNAEFNLIKSEQTSFYNEIKETGKVLYEKTS